MDTLSKDVEYMSHPDKWVAWPLCPLKRRGTSEIGILIAAKDVRTCVFEANMFSGTNWRKEALAFIEGRETSIPVHEYDSFEAIAADHWVVD